MRPRRRPRRSVRRNADEHLQRLQRAAAAGDAEAERELEIARARGLLPPRRLNRLEQYVENLVSDIDSDDYLRIHLSPLGEYGLVPHSELAMHSGAAGAPVFQYALLRFWDSGMDHNENPTSAMVLHEDKLTGELRTLRGGVGEVLPDQVRRDLGGFGQERFP